MLFLEGDQQWKNHEASGASFLLDAVGDDEYRALRKQHQLQDGTVDHVGFVQDFGVRAIKDWKGVGDKANNRELPCTEENVRKLARVHCNSLMLWVIDQANGLHRYIEAKVDDAKKD